MPFRSAAPPQRAWLQACRGEPHTVMCMAQRSQGLAPRRKQRTAQEAGRLREATELPLPAGTPRRSASPPHSAWLQACGGVTHTVIYILQRGRGSAPAAQAAHGPGDGAAEGGHGASLTRRHATPQRLAASARMATSLQGCNAYRHVCLTAGTGHGARVTSSARPGRRGSRGRPWSFPYPPARRAAAPRRLSAHGYKPAGE